MKWGAAFQLAWERSRAPEKAAARQAATSPEDAAGIMSDAIRHSLQLALYAHQDLELLRRDRKAQDAATKPIRELEGVSRAIRDVELGRVSAQRAHLHVQDAARDAAEKLAARLSADAHGAENGKPNQADMAPDRLPVLTRKAAGIGRQLAARQEEIDRKMAASVEEHADELPQQAIANARFSLQLAAAFAALDTIFLPGKSVESPIAPLPPAVKG